MWGIIARGSQEADIGSLFVPSGAHRNYFASETRPGQPRQWQCQCQCQLPRPGRRPFDDVGRMNRLVLRVSCPTGLKEVFG